jgi:hypothetical protein
MNEYYVYVYIDPRNFEEFYYGKGKDRRKDAHLTDDSDTDKTKRIAAIRLEGLKPIVRVIARGLTEDEAFLIEKTLLWKLGKTLTNIATGSFSEKFRPHDKLHLELSGFDYVGGVYYFNIGEGPHRRWSDNKALGFISAGQGVRWRDAILGFREGDIFAAYLKDRGFVGIGRITQRAKPIRAVTIKNTPLISHALDCKKMDDNIDSDELCEYVALVHWDRAVEQNEAKWLKKSGLYTTTHVRASLEGQQETLRFLEEQFDVDFRTFRERREQAL